MNHILGGRARLEVDVVVESACGGLPGEDAARATFRAARSDAQSAAAWPVERSRDAIGVDAAEQFDRDVDIAVRRFRPRQATKQIAPVEHMDGIEAAAQPDVQLWLRLEADLSGRCRGEDDDGNLLSRGAIA